MTKGKMMWHMLGVLLFLYGGLVLWLYFFQSRLIYFPESGREIAATPVQAGLSYEDVQLVTADGVKLHGWYVPAPESRGAVLFFHGNAGNVSHRLNSVQMFHRLGYSVLIFDYRGYGNSEGTPGEQGTYRDSEAAWQYLVEQRQIPPCRIVIYGESLGGSIASWLAARQKPAVLVIASSFTSVADLGQQLYPYLPVRWLVRIRYDTRDNLSAVSVPVLIAHSPEDDVIPFAHGRALFEAAHLPKQFLELSGGHNDGFIFMREAWVKTLNEFLSGHMDSACR